MTQQQKEDIDNRIRVIIVEDDIYLRKSVIEYLTIEGYDVTGACSAREFYYHIFAQTFAVVILDIGLPDQNGLVLAEYARKNSDMRIIMFTARCTIEDKLAGHEAGADIYLVKPVDFRELSASITTLLGRLEKAQYEPTQLIAEQSSWRLIRNKWLLLTPQKATIKLTAKELEFMILLVSNTNATAARLDLLNNLGYHNNESGNRSLESLIKRLRHKFTLLNIESPIQTTHGIGYSFVEDITVE